MATSTENRRFKEEIVYQIPDDLLETAINWISSNLNPKDVFSYDALTEWAEDNGFTKETIESA